MQSKWESVFGSCVHFVRIVAIVRKVSIMLQGTGIFTITETSRNWLKPFRYFAKKSPKVLRRSAAISRAINTRASKSTSTSTSTEHFANTLEMKIVMYWVYSSHTPIDNDQILGWLLSDLYLDESIRNTISNKQKQKTTHQCESRSITINSWRMRSREMYHFWVCGVWGRTFSSYLDLTWCYSVSKCLFPKTCKKVLGTEQGTEYSSEEYS